MLFLFVYNAGKCRAGNNGHRKITTKIYYSFKIHEGNNPGRTVRQPRSHGFLAINIDLL